MRILIAEDESISRTLIRTNLERWGHEVTVCKDGREAWEAIQRPDAPPLAVLDWEMPHMEGVEVCRRARELPHGKLSYIIMLTVKERKEDIVRGLESGANDYITKPFDPQEFRARIMVGIRVVELQQQLISTERSTILAQAAGEAAHEINQPLTVLLGTTQLLMMHTSKEDKNRQGVEDLFKAAQKINAIIKKGSDIRR